VTLDLTDDSFRSLSISDFSREGCRNPKIIIVERF
jgi:hypothetical protein